MANTKKKEVVIDSGYSTINLPCTKVEASLNQMTGIEEEILTDNKLVRNAGKLITELLYSVVETLDGKKPSKDTIRQLMIGDRDALLLELRKISLGSEMEAKFQCGNCNASIEVVENLDEVEILELNGELKETMEIELVDGYKDREGEVHKIAVVAYPNGDVQEKTSVIMRQNFGRGNTAMLKECIKEIGSVKPVTNDMIRRLTKRDRDHLLTVISKDAPGPKLKTTVDCYDCGYSFETALDLSNFFVSNL